MSNFRPMSGAQQLRVPTPPRGDSIARYATYLEAQRAVDHLSDNQFPVQMVTIVGTGLRMVERVTGRLTYPRVALAGAASGAYFGLFVGLLLTLFGTGTGGAFLGAVLVGAAFGMLFGLISYALSRGRRDFTSTSQIVAGEYEVLCLPEQAGAARQLLAALAAQGGPRPTSGVSPLAAPQAPQQPDPYRSTAAAPALPPPPPGAVPSPGAPPYGSPAGATAAGAGSDGPEATSPAGQPPVSGPTYGDMMERQRRERAERERLQREEVRAEQARVQQAREEQRTQRADRAERDERAGHGVDDAEQRPPV